MRRMVDLRCSCGEERINQLLEEDQVVRCACGKSMEQVWWKRRRQNSTCWGKDEEILVFRDPATDKLRYPGRNDVQTPQGYERVVLRSDREVAAFEKQYNVKSERRWFDRGSGRGFDDLQNGQKLTH